MTIFGYKKAGMTEKEYHDYISITHAGHLKALLVKNDIVSYTMVSKTSYAADPTHSSFPGTSVYARELEADRFWHKSNTIPLR